MKRRVVFAVIVVTAAAAFAFVPSGSERTYKLNGPLALSPAGSVVGYKLTADTSRVVYLSQDAGGPVLLSAPVDGSADQIQLNAPLAPGQRVTEFHLTPDSALAVFRADQDVDDRFELYSVPVDGSQPPTKLSGDLPEDRDVRGIFALTPDGSRAVYRADANTDQVNELFSVPVDGSAPPVRLSGPLGSSQRIEPVFAIAPDGSRVVFRTDTLGTYELFSAMLDGSGSPDALGETGSLDSMEIAPDSSRVVYLSFGDLPGFREVFSVPIDGSGPAVKLNGVLVANADVESFGVSPDSTRVVYVADQDVLDVPEIFSAPIDGSGAEVKLNTPLAPGTAVGVGQFRIAPDASRVVFWAIQDLAVRQALFSAPLDGSLGAVQLSGNDVAPADFAISPDSSRVLYRRFDSGDKLFSAPLDGGGAPLLISTPATQANPVLSFFLAPTGGQVVFELGYYELYSAPFDGSGPAVQLVPDVFLSDPLEVQISLDGLQVVFLTDLEFAGVLQLYGVPIDGSQPAVALSESLYGILTGRVLTYQFSPDGRWVVYSAWGDTPSAVEIYSVPADRSSPAVKLNTTVVPNGDIYQYTITPDSSGVVYRGDQDQDDVFELYHAPIDGSQPATKLNDPLGPDADVGFGTSSGPTHYLVCPDSERVVYMADLEADDFFDLYSVPLDRSESPVKLNAPFVSQFPVTGYRISADSARVVYAGEQDAVDVNELYVAPIDGSVAPIKLSGSMVANGDLSTFQLTPDGSHAVYRADQELDGLNELYAVPIDGSAAPIKLSGNLPVVSDVFSFKIAPDSGSVVYRADPDVDEEYELFSVLLNGTGRLQLNSDPVLDGDVSTHYEVTQDSTGVVFSGDLRVEGLQEIFYAPLGVAGSQVRISGDFVQFGAIRSWRISPDSSRVVFNGDIEQDTWWRLYSVPTTGGAVTRINGPLIFPGDVQSIFAISPDSSYVLYTADQEINGLLEVYAVPIDGRLEAPFSLKASPPNEESDIFVPRPSPDASRVAFLAPLEQVFELYATDLVPRVTRVSPGLGPPSGGNTVTLHGCGFTPEVEVSIGGEPATSVTYVSASELRVTVPANQSLTTPTTGPPSGRLRRAVIPRLEVDVEVSIAGIGSTFEAGYVYAPASRR